MFALEVAGPAVELRAQLAGGDPPLVHPPGKQGPLPEVDVPTLVVVGDRDLFTPRKAAEKIVRKVPGAELMVVPGGTHYVAVEYPELINLRLEKFFLERGYPPRPV